jgi:RNA polymerase sigma-70 factor, ECF subfamily
MSDEKDPDCELVAEMVAYQAGDLEAFQRLFRTLASELGSFFAATVRDVSLCDDLVQETFLALHRVRQTYLPPLPVRPWVFGIARNVERRHRRVWRRRGAHETPFDDADAQATRISEDTALERRDLASALRRLPASRREAWVLHHVHGLSFAEIAARLRIGLDAAKLRSSRAMIALRALLGEARRG